MARILTTNSVRHATNAIEIADLLAPGLMEFAREGPSESPSIDHRVRGSKGPAAAPSAVLVTTGLGRLRLME